MVAPPDSGALPDLLAHFELGERLGAGAYGEVLRATRRADGVPVAAKVLRLDDPEARRRTAREAALLAGLEHPNLVRLHGLFRGPEERPVLVYELVRGVTLEEQLARQPPDPAGAIRWVEELAAGLEALHACGVVHRDLKPANVMIEPGGRARLLDYGLARAVERGQTVTAEGVVIGTPVYMAPEVFDGHRPSPADDVYALACLAYTLVAGRPAHAGDRPFEVLEAKRRPAPTLPAREELPAARRARLERFFARALAPDAAARPATPRELAEGLVEALGGDPSAAPLAATRASAGVPARSASVVPGRTRAIPASPVRPGERPDAVLDTGAFLRRTARRSLPVLAGAALVGALLWAWPGGPVRPGPSPAPPRAPEDSRWTRLADDLQRQLHALDGFWVDPAGSVHPLPDVGGLPSGGRALKDEDPLLHLVRRSRLPALEGYLTQRAAGTLELHALGDEDRAALRKVGELFQAQGLPDPFWPLLDVRPGEPLPPGDDPAYQELRQAKFERERGEIPSDSPGPWLRTTWARATRMRALGEAVEDQLDTSTSPLVRRLGLAPQTGFSDDPLFVFGAHFQQRELRPELTAALREERRAYQAFLWAVGRTARHGTPEEGHEAAHLAWEVGNGYRFLFYSHLALVPVEEVVGVSGETMAEAWALFSTLRARASAGSASPAPATRADERRLLVLARRLVEGPLEGRFHMSRAREALQFLEPRLGEDSAEFRDLRAALARRVRVVGAPWLERELGAVQ